ncbi:hypothetical protein FJY93_04595 [Candidatus Kaiserbacteria bacterium]|nr:hypothetical protein [Candidatus Kaiserbacteria bacterium]
MTITLVAKQHYNGRLYRVRELIELGAFENGYLSVPEMEGRVPMRYPHSWQARTIIQMARQTQPASGLAWGADWCGRQVYRIEQVCLSPHERKESTLPLECIGNASTIRILYFSPRSINTGTPLKVFVKDYFKNRKIPHALMRLLTEKIRERDRNVWVTYSAQRELGQLMGEGFPLAAE